MNTFLISDKAYDILRKITTIVLPALATAVFGIFEIWGFDMTLCAQINGTIAVVETFLAALLGISTATWKANQ